MGVEWERTGIDFHPDANLRRTALIEPSMLLGHRMGAMATKRPNWGETPWRITFQSHGTTLPENVDFAVVGGGFTGLSAGAWLARLAPKKTVLLLEAERVGNGASGRTGGMTLAQTAAGDLPGLGDVLRGYRKILRDLRVDAELELPGVWEVARHEKSMEGKKVRPLKNSPIDWEDSGRVRAVNTFPGGTVNPGKVVSGLAQAANRAGVQIVEEAEVVRMEFSDPVRLRVERKLARGIEKRVVTAKKVLLATNAASRELAGKIYSRKELSEPRLTFAVATAPLTKNQITALGMESGRPFYSVDFPYLWGRMLKDRGMIFGSGLVPAFGKFLREDAARAKSAEAGVIKLWGGLERFDVRRGEPAARLRSLEKRVRLLHPELKKVRITHSWGGPILTTKDFMPTFRAHPESKNVVVLGGFSGHGVALSVYLGSWAAEHFLGKRRLPRWHKS
jgi:glycine/D-amino acid oxidase-like deaminating enzyme